ncbi:MAG: hypothetical protein L6Q98_21675 [Anaerolineae bacterium]|nr:hypothetical protein [Anaerolineae bacterium]NUQ06661.1 hypothetical protein [Anaerolineae bacterium]
MVLAATDEEVYGTLQPFVDQFAGEHNTGAINLGNIRAIRNRLPEPWHLANCVGVLQEKGSLAEIADTWLDFERQQPAAESTIRGRDLVREAIDELLAPLPEDPRIERFELSLQISTGNIIHKEVADVEDAIDFIRTYFADRQAILRTITPRQNRPSDDSSDNASDTPVE